MSSRLVASCQQIPPPSVGGRVKAAQSLAGRLIAVRLCDNHTVMWLPEDLTALSNLTSLAINTVQYSGISTVEIGKCARQLVGPNRTWCSWHVGR